MARNQFVLFLLVLCCIAGMVYIEYGEKPFLNALGTVERKVKDFERWINRQ